MRHQAIAPATSTSRPAHGRLPAIVRSLRAHQWVKNCLVFIPLVLGGKAADLNAWLAALTGFVALSLTCSATYLINDLVDVKADRLHRTKRHRPLASGHLSPSTAVLLATVGLSLGILVSISLGFAAAVALLAYLALTLCYTLLLKKVAIVDTFVIATLFTMRLVYGIAINDVRISPWLLVFSMFTFLSLCLAKRNTEVQLYHAAGERISGRGYVRADAPLILGLGLAAALASTTILILYLIEDAFPHNFYAHPQWLWSLPAILFLFFGRIWLVSQRSQMSDDPVEFALKDPTCLIYGAATLLAVILALA